MKNKDVLVIGLGCRGRAACELLRRNGARVMVVDSENNEDLRQRAEQLRPLGVEVELGVSSPPERVFSLAVWSQTALKNLPLVQAVRRNKVPLIGELELGYQHASCLSIAIARGRGGPFPPSCSFRWCRQWQCSDNWHVDTPVPALR